ncbi:MAG TPA: AmmeMemoRadiSam system radical SAM enzyme [Lachnospiraceae bacterium]|nr:AmmeMemoRadiSam system radical SAM enzyme [Lachnospiraceae bacterium]
MAMPDKDNGSLTVCETCMHHCALKEGKTGICGARKNVEGRILDINYGQITSMALDPIEKKPLRMFCPGSRVLSVGSFGCNLKCPFCQNYEISRMDESSIEARRITPEELVETALRLKKQGSIGIAYTYNEPLVGWEFVRDTSRLAESRGLKNILVTNGTADLPILERLIRSIDAMNIDLKGFTEDYYRFLGGDLETVKAFIERAARSCHIEVTTLIVPGRNDSEEEMERLSEWLSWVGYGIPLHITRYFPRYRMKTPATDIDTVYRLAEVARRNLKYVFVGNC